MEAQEGIIVVSDEKQQEKQEKPVEEPAEEEELQDDGQIDKAELAEGSQEIIEVSDTHKTDIN